MFILTVSEASVGLSSSTSGDCRSEWEKNCILRFFRLRSVGISESSFDLWRAVPWSLSEMDTTIGKRSPISYTNFGMPISSWNWVGMSALLKNE